MEEDISRPFNLPCTSRQSSVHSLPPSGRGYRRGSGLLDRLFSSRCELGDRWSGAISLWVGKHSCPIPRNFPHRQISPRESSHLSFSLLGDPSVTNCCYLYVLSGLGGGFNGPPTSVQSSSFPALLGQSLDIITCKNQFGSLLGIRFRTEVT